MCSRYSRAAAIRSICAPSAVGTVASLVSAEFSIVSGGLACIAGAALLTVLLPGFRRYRPALAS